MHEGVEDMKEKKKRLVAVLAALALFLSAALHPGSSAAAGASSPAMEFSAAPVGSRMAAASSGKTVQGSRTAQRDAAAVSVGDEAGLLTDAERARLSEKILRIEQKHGVRIGIQTRDSVQGSAGKAANALLDANYSGGPNGGIVLLVVMGSRDWYISTDNAMRKRITDDAGYRYLSGQFLPDLGDGRYAAAFMAYVDTVDSMLSYYEQEGKPYDPANEFSWLALLIAAALAILGGISLRSMLIASMSNVRHASEASAYLVQDSVNLTESTDRFLFMNVTRVRKEKHSSSTSASDSSHGGGGGKF